jgi:hypothetical protein
VARLLPLILGLVLGLPAWSGRGEEAIAAYRALQKHISEVRRTLPGDSDPGAALTALNIERDSIDAQYPYHPKEPAALTAERRKADVEIRSLTRRKPASKPKPRKAKRK